LPPKEGGKVSINQDRDLMDEETDESEFVSRPKEEILVDVPNAAAAIQDENVRQNIIANPEQGLAEIAQQLHSTEGEASTATKVFGRDLADLALEMYPTREAADEALQKQSAVSVQMPGEVSKPQTTEIKPAETVQSNVPEFTAKSEKHFEYVPIEEVDIYKEFDRETDEKFNKKELDDLTDDISKNGIKTPIQIKVDRNGNALIVEGNTRLAAAKRLGIKNIPVEIIEGEFGSINKGKAKPLPNVGVSELQRRQKTELGLKDNNGAYSKGFTRIEQPKPAEPIEEDMTAFVKVTRPELGFEELPTDILDNMDSKTMAVQGKRLEGLNKNLSKLQELFNCIWT